MPSGKHHPCLCPGTNATRQNLKKTAVDLSRLMNSGGRVQGASVGNLHSAQGVFQPTGFQLLGLVALSQKNYTNTHYQPNPL